MIYVGTAGNPDDPRLSALICGRFLVFDDRDSGDLLGGIQ
jgi:hypothetical protein